MRNESKRSKPPVPLSSWRLRQAVCSTFSRSGWSVLRSVSLSKGGTSRKRPSPHLHKVPTRYNKVIPRTFQMALVWTSTRQPSATATYPEIKRKLGAVKESNNQDWRNVQNGAAVALTSLIRGSRPFCAVWKLGAAVRRIIISKCFIFQFVFLSHLDGRLLNIQISCLQD
jgi:hypothetical protein